MRNARLFYAAGWMHFVTVLHESGLVWCLFERIPDGAVIGAVAYLERGGNVAKKRAELNGNLTFAEKLLVRQKEQAGRVAEAFDEDFVNETPNVHDLLTRVLRDGKKVLEPATLLIYARAGSWHACVSHKSLGVKWWGEGGTIRSALAKLEASCAAEMGQEASESTSPTVGPS